MRSIKPGRGPSRMGVAGGVAASLFGVFWCVVAASMGAGFMVPFGLIFIGLAVYNVIYNYHNATSEKRYSIIDIVDGDEEPDPLNEIYGKKASVNRGYGEENGTSAEYCPFCGKSVDSEFDFCPKCGKELPD